MADEQFRTEIRDWLEANCPKKCASPSVTRPMCIGAVARRLSRTTRRKQWFEACRDKGYTVPDWPTEVGGAGLTAAEAKILRQEMAAINARSPLSSFGIWMLGPALLKFGTDEQKTALSDPDRTRRNSLVPGLFRTGQRQRSRIDADLRRGSFDPEGGDHWVVNGQKIWTSYADEADWIFCLVRTDKANKYQGITFMLFDMESEGVSTKPILLISGNSPFCETFFDDVKVPQRPICRRGQSRLGRGEISARPRTRDDFGRGRR